MEKVFYISKRKRKPHIKHHSQAGDLWACFEVPEWGVFCHTARLRNRPPRLKLVLSDNTGRFPRPLKGLLAK
jgi:hypothetical protein